MRFIRQADVQVRLPNDWQSQINEAKKTILAKVRNAARAARNDAQTGKAFRKAVCKAAHKAINECDSVWSNAKRALAEVSFEKCWYCECRQERSDLHVDHFRPKGRIMGETDHPGYWWFAFEWRNFRLACTFCNCIRADFQTEEKGGKGDRFPIFDNPPRMQRPLDRLDRTKLLDPVVRQDVEKLTFTRNGLPMPLSVDVTSEDWIRVEETIQVFHLRETRLKRAREELAIELEEDFTLANRCYENGDMVAFGTAADKLVSRIRPDAKYATFARLVLGIHRDKEWVEKLWTHI